MSVEDVQRALAAAVHENNELRAALGRAAKTLELNAEMIEYLDTDTPALAKRYIEITRQAADALRTAALGSSAPAAIRGGLT